MEVYVIEKYTDYKYNLPATFITFCGILSETKVLFSILPDLTLIKTLHKKREKNLNRTVLIYLSWFQYIQNT